MEVVLPDRIESRRRTRTYDMKRDNDGDALAALIAVSTPTGALIPTLSSTAPTTGAWLLCNGAAVSKADFPSLYAVIGGAFGQTSTTFNLPDLRGRTVIGQDGGTIAALRASVGAASVTLTVDQLPAHSHTVTDPGHDHPLTDPGHVHTVTDPGHIHGITDPGHTHATDRTTSGIDAVGVGTANAALSATASAVTGITVNSATTGVTVDEATTGATVEDATTGITVAETGGGESVSIIPPAMGVNWLVRT
jgi:microcystin-dependent protein